MRRIAGIILAAGRGTRFQGSNGDPKCLASIGGTSLIERQVRSLRDAGINDITIVVGFGGSRVREVCGPGIRYIENPIFEQTDSLYSLSLARASMALGFVVLNSDVLFAPSLLQSLIDSPHEDALLVHYTDGSTALGSEEMKVQVRAGLVVDLSKTMAPSEAHGENVGIAKFGAAGTGMLISQIDALLGANCGGSPAPRAFFEFAQRRPLYAISTRGLPWIEIDFPEDYRRAMAEILPHIDLVETARYTLPSA